MTLDYAAKIVPFILGGDLQARVQGVVVHGLTEEELDLLDEFEGDVSFRRFSPHLSLPNPDLHPHGITITHRSTNKTTVHRSA